MLIKIDKTNKFVSKFNQKTGLYIRSGVIEGGKDTGVDPFMTEFPELLDIGIMGHCYNVGICPIPCYQNAAGKSVPHMGFDDFKKLMGQCKNLVFQVALGGRGDPNKHPQWGEILKCCRDNNVVPNFTTSGIGLTDDEVALAKKYCGASAVSWHNTEYTISAASRLRGSGIITNIHFVLSKSSIADAIDMLDRELDADAIIFLLHKPVGQGDASGTLSPDDPRLLEFFKAIDKGPRKFKIGFDSCTVPAIINFSKQIMECTVEPCDAGRFSMYIGPDLIATPCSLDQKFTWGVNLHQCSIREAWVSQKFSSFREIVRGACHSCGKRQLCHGGCHIIPGITLCGGIHEN